MYFLQQFLLKTSLILIGLIGLISLVILAFVGYKILFDYSVAKPSPKMVQLAEEITKYPSSTNWELRKVEPHCGVMAFDGCPVALVVLEFESSDDWSSVSKFYTQELKKLGWSGSEYNETAYSGSVSSSGLQFKKDSCLGFLTNKDDPKPIKGSYRFYIEGDC